MTNKEERRSLPSSLKELLKVLKNEEEINNYAMKLVRECYQESGEQKS